MEETQPSMFGRFLKGAMSGAFSGSVMMGILGLVSLTGALPWTLGGAAVLVLCTSLFGGVMGAIRGGHSHYTNGRGPNAVESITPVIAQSQGMMPQVGMDAAPDAAPARADGKSWTETAGRVTGASTAVDKILADGAMTDRDRANAILAAREASSAEAAR